MDKKKRTHNPDDLKNTDLVPSPGMNKTDVEHQRRFFAEKARKNREFAKKHKSPGHDLRADDAAKSVANIRKRSDSERAKQVVHSSSKERARGK